MMAYVRFSQPEPHLLLEKKESMLGRRVLVFDPVLEENPSLSLGDRFRRIGSALRDVDAVIFRGSSAWETQGSKSFRRVVEEDPILRELLKGQAVGLLHIAVLPEGGRALKLEPLRVDGISSFTEDEWLEEVRDLELASFLRVSDALLADPNTHYAIPSGLHAAEFIAVDRLFSEPTTVYRIADWFLEDLNNTKALLIDQRSMLPLAFALRSLAAIWFNSLPPVRLLGSYPAEVTTMVSAITDLMDRTRGGGEILFILSVNSTGRIARYFQAVASPGSRVWALYDANLEPEPGAAPTLAHHPIQRYTVSDRGECALCNERSLTGINPETFEREPYRKPQFLKATRTHLQKDSSFWKIVDEADACRLHHDDPRLRHHPIFFEIDRLLAHPAFRAQALEALAKIPKPKIVLIPNHSGSAVVRDLLVEAFPGVSVEILPEGREIPSDMGPRIAASDPILIADDAIITTQTITSLKLQIYRICKRYGQSPRLEVFAVIARPSSSAALKDLDNRLLDHAGGHLHYAQQILLPYPSKDHCVFCVERDILNEVTKNLSEEVRDYAVERTRHLRGTVEVPLPSPGDSERIRGSFLGENLRKRTIFAGVQAVAQDMIDEIQQKEGTSESWRVDASDLITKFFDAEILGAFLRSFGRRFLWWPGHEERIAHQLADYPGSQASVALAAEIGWSAALGRLPVEPVVRFLERHPDEMPIRLMRELINLHVYDPRQVLAQDSESTSPSVPL